MEDKNIQSDDAEPQIQFRLSEMNVQEFFFNSQWGQEKSDLEKAGYSISHSIAAFSEEDLLRIQVRAVLHAPQEVGDETDEVSEESVEIGGATVNGFFEVLDLEQYETEEGHIQLPDEFIANLLGIVISSVRGTLLAYGSGTPLDEHLLPVLNPTRRLFKKSS